MFRYVFTVALTLSAPIHSLCASERGNDPEVPAHVEAAASIANFVVTGQVPSSVGVPAYILESPSDRILVYDVNGHVVIPNAIIDGQGNNTLAAEQSAYLYDVADAFEKLTASDMLISGGNDAPAELIGVYEPYCGFCARAVNALKDKGIKINWAPVSFLHPKSPAVLAGILRADDPYAALIETASVIPAKHDAEWIANNPAPSDEVAAAKTAMAEHYEYMGLAGIRGTPAFIAMVNGVPQKVDMQWVLDTYGTDAE